MSKRYLLHISIGPVQEFIADARRIKDLWAGSKLLAAITRESLEPFLQEDDVEIIVPSPSLIGQGKQSLHACIPNRLIITVPEEKLDKLITASKSRLLVEAANQNGDSWWGKLTGDAAQTIKKKCGDEIASGINWKLWDDQCQDIWEYNWVAMQYDEKQDAYRSRVNRIMLALEERKLTRDFKQWNGSNAFKCTQCGKRENVGPVEWKSYRQFWDTANNVDPVRIKKGDRLCAVCLVKRYIATQQLLKSKTPVRFQSTADIAITSFKSALDDKKQEPEVKELLSAANNLLGSLSWQDEDTDSRQLENHRDIPGLILYRDQLTVKRLVQEFCPSLEGDQAKESEIKRSAEFMSEAIADIKKEHGLGPCKYYVLFAMDGDEMGKFMSDVNSIEEQQEKGELLGNLAMDMPEKMGKDWKPVYSGGDDLLAMGPLENALDVIYQIRNMFCERLKTYDRSASGGIVVTHYHNPLRKSLEILRENVEKAKDDFGRDSLVITVWLSSGSLISAGFKWDEYERIIKPFMDYIENGLSPNYIHELHSELDAFYDDVYLNEDMFIAEAKRLLLRHSKNIKSISTDEEEFLQRLASAATPKASGASSAMMEAERVKGNFANILRIVAFLARQKIYRRDSTHAPLS